MGMEIRVNGVRIKQPVYPQLTTHNLTKSGRTSSGTMTMDLVAKKKKLFLKYEVLSGRDLEQILQIVDGEAMFFNVSYVENGISKGFTAYVGEIDRTLHRGGGLNGWYWTDVSLNFIEQ